MNRVLAYAVYGGAIVCSLLAGLEIGDGPMTFLLGLLLSVFGYAMWFRSSAADRGRDHLRLWLLLCAPGLAYLLPPIIHGGATWSDLGPGLLGASVSVAVFVLGDQLHRRLGWPQRSSTALMLLLASSVCVAAASAYVDGDDVPVMAAVLPVIGGYPGVVGAVLEVPIVIDLPAPEQFLPSCP